MNFIQVSNYIINFAHVTHVERHDDSSLTIYLASGETVDIDDIAVAKTLWSTLQSAKPSIVHVGN